MVLGADPFLHNNRCSSDKGGFSAGDSSRSMPFCRETDREFKTDPGTESRPACGAAERALRHGSVLYNHLRFLINQGCAAGKFTLEKAVGWETISAVQKQI